MDGIVSLIPEPCRQCRRKRHVDKKAHASARCAEFNGLVLGEERQEDRLRHPHDVREPRLQEVAKVEEQSLSVAAREGRAEHFDVLPLMQPVGEADFVQNLEKSWVDGIPPKIAVEITS